MRRILSFHGFFLILRFTWSWMYFGFYLRLHGADCSLHKKSVYSPQCNKNPYKSTRHKGTIPKIKNQWRTDPSHPSYPWLILNAASEPKASEHDMRNCHIELLIIKNSCSPCGRIGHVLGIEFSKLDWIMNYILLLRLTAQCARAQNGSRITRMRRILSFHGFFYFWIYLFLDFLRIVFAPVRRGLPTV